MALAHFYEKKKKKEKQGIPAPSNAVLVSARCRSFALWWGKVGGGEETGSITKMDLGWDLEGGGGLRCSGNDEWRDGSLDQLPVFRFRRFFFFLLFLGRLKCSEMMVTVAYAV